MKAKAPKTLFVSVAGIALMGAVAGCAPNATSGSSASGAASPSAQGSSAENYKDGTYSADGNYVSPNGQEKIGVTLTLNSGTVSELNLTPYPTNPATEKFQGEFIAGVNALVVGKKIDDLNVTKVSGSSLTSGGFNAAISDIMNEAKN